MPIRPATYQDLLPASKVLSRAFEHEPLFANYILSNRKDYPEEAYLHFLQKIRKAYFGGPSNHILVSISTDSEGKEECITGLAVWSRYTASPQPEPVTRQLVRSAVKTYNRLESLVYPNRAMDLGNADILQRAHEFNKHHWTGTRSEVWALEVLGTDPEFEKRGFGRELVKWGFDRAREEGVGCSVVASYGKERFYQNCGFDVVVGVSREFGGDANPLKDVVGGTILFWDNGIEPKGVKKYGEQ